MKYTAIRKPVKPPRNIAGALDGVSAGASLMPPDHAGERMNTAHPAVLQSRSGAANVLQRKIYVALDKDSIVSTDWDDKRFPTNLSNEQGDHTTPHTVLQSQISNAIEGVKLVDAWSNLEDTYKVYQSLPGWSLTKKFVTSSAANILDPLFQKKNGDINALQTAVHIMLWLRNQIEYTALKKGGYGKGEAKWAGGLQQAERKFQLGGDPGVVKKDVVISMWMAFDHGRFNNLQNTQKQKDILKQHCITIVDAYPLVAKSVGLNANGLLGEFTNYDWSKY